MTTCSKIALCARAAAVLAVVGVATASLHAQVSNKSNTIRQTGVATKTTVKDKNVMLFTGGPATDEQDGLGRQGPMQRGAPTLDCTQRSAFGAPEFNCHDFEYPRIGGTSILSIGTASRPTRVADQFFVRAGAANTMASQVCFWGAYSAVTPTFQCVPTGTPSGFPTPGTADDNFVVKYWAVDVPNGGLPGALLAEYRQDGGGTGPLTLVTRRQHCNPAAAPNPALSFAEYTVQHPPLALAENTCYFIEIHNEILGSAAATANWFWGHADPGGGWDNQSLQDANNIWQQTDIQTGATGDRAFCINVDMGGIGDTANSCPITNPPTCTNPAANGQPRGADNGFGLFSASPSPAAVGLQLAERFTTTTAGAITDICFWGFWVDIASGTIVAGPPAGGARFDVTFYDNNNGQPGNVIQAFQVGTGGTTATQVASNNWLMTLGGTGFVAAADTCYFFSISILSEAANPSFNLRWGWGGASANDSLAIRDNLSHSRTAAGATDPGTWANQVFTGPPCNDIHYLFNVGPMAMPNCAVTQGACCTGQSCSFGTALACNTGGGTYQGDGSTCVAGRTCIPAPANDECAGATPVVGLGSFPFDSRSATDSTPDPSAAPIGSDVWFSWQAPCDGDFTFDVCGTIAVGSNTDTVLAVYNDDCVTEVASNDDNGPICAGVNSSVRLLTVVGGTNYRIRIGTFGNGSGGTNGTFQIGRDGGGCPSAGGACCCGSACTNVANSGLCVSPGGGIPVAFVAGGNCSPFSVTTPCCRANFNRSTTPPVISSQDIFDFLAAFFSTNVNIKACADFNGEPPSAANVTSQDIFDFLAAFFRPGGCTP